MRRSSWIILVPVLGMSAAAAGPDGTVRPEPSPLTTHDPDLYLFVDDHWIAEQRHLTRVLNQPRVLAEPVIQPDEPLTERDCAWGNVIREPDGRFRLWYTTMMMGHVAGGGHEMAKAGVWGRGDDFSFYPRSAADVRETETMLGKYAESTDGLRWFKPELGLHEFRGNRRNNIVLTGAAAARQTDGALTNFDGFTVVRDDAERDPQKRYKMIAHWESIHFWDEHEYSGKLGRPASAMARYGEARGKYLTFSPDGLRWDQPLVRLDIEGFGDRCLVVRDRRNQRWWLNNRPRQGYEAAGLATSSDLTHWTPTEPCLHRDSPKHPQVESLIPFNYGNQDLGFLITQVKGRMMLAYLVAHHDGGPWRRIGKVPDEPFIPPGPEGSYYATGAVPLHNEPLIVGDEMLIYFNAFSYNQEPPCPQGSRSIGVARMRRDAFVGLASASRSQAVPRTQGHLITRPVTVAGPRLYLNMEQRQGNGSVMVALLDPEGVEIAGFTMDDAVTLEADAVRLPVEWKTGADARELLGRQVKLKIVLSGDVVIYAFKWGA